MKSIATILLLIWSMQATAGNGFHERADVQAFMKAMVERHGFQEQGLREIFAEVSISDSVLEAIARPAEKLPWHRYREIFVKPDRVAGGVEFWKENADALRRAEDAYGVPAHIIVAIIGVETRYGGNAGRYKVIDSLSTLAFEYPRRADFFRGELEQFLLLAREQGLDPLDVRGSYAGAMGIPQFISSSYRHYAVDFDIDGLTDIWSSDTDAIGSVANYFKLHGWLSGGPVVVPLGAAGAGPGHAVSGGLEPDLTAAELAALGLEPPLPVPPGERVKLLELEAEDGPEYWLGFWNFYVITRYNHSALYAMAVYQLAERIREEYRGNGG